MRFAYRSDTGVTFLLALIIIISVYMYIVYENKICSKLIQLNSNENWRDVMVRCQHVLMLLRYFFFH